MPFKFIQIVISGFIFLLTLSMPVAANDRLVKSIWIDGHGYDAVLEPNRHLRIIGSSAAESLAGEHYKGHFPEDPDSWVRISRLDSGWEGLAFVFGRMHTLGGSSQSDQAASFSFSQVEAPQCGVDHVHSEAAITPDSLADMATVQAVSANYDTLCADKVDGVCLMMELELAFDQQFQSNFPKDYESRAGAILNMVEGFYADQFGIVFDTLSLTFMGEELFDSTLDAESLLNDITSKRGNREISFLESEQSIFHFVSGRNFEGSTAGVAWVGTICSGSGNATGITNAFDSNATTAVVVAHEIGHNLGAGHDGTGTSCEAGKNIMSPYVDSSATSFSNCSFQQITERISNLPAVEQCFNFPADAAILDVDGNPLEVEPGASFQTNFNVAYRQAAEPADGLTITGMIGESEGQLQGVSIDGNSCTLLDDTSFSCNGVAARANLPLSVNAVAGSSPTFTLLQNVTLTTSTGDVKDIRPDNDSLLSEITIASSETSEPDDQDGAGTSATPRKTDADTSESGSSSGGGGGAIHWLWLLLGIAGAAIHRRSLA
ncbi:MAG: M12 family metallo-peptidase [Marinobacter sp.]|nr:M12 family metallo-peptidase [Marinobacter sp.]